MTVVREISRDAGIGVHVAGKPQGLAEIHRPDCAAAIWQRQDMPSFLPWLDALEPERLPNVRVILRPTDVRDVALRVCEASGTPKCANRDRLLDDVSALTERFAGLTGAPFLRLRLDVVTTDACRRFHIDAVTARLICTYRGTGTQYGNSIDGAQPRQIRQVATGAPIILRGTLWPEQPASGLLHRSPPIEGTGETRFMMVVDPLDDPGEQD